MTKKPGEKLKIGEVKAAIISFILESKDTVNEPNIRKHLKTVFEIQHQGTINTHLHKLAELKCIESVTPNRKRRSNFWDITKLEHLKNIRREFPDIKINTYEKSIMIIFKERGYSLDRIGNLIFYIELFLSVSLFNAFLDNDYYELITKSRRIYLREEGLGKVRSIEYHLTNFTKLYEEANPGFKFKDEIAIDSKNKSKEDFVKGFEDKYHGITDEMIKELEEAYTAEKELSTELDKKTTEMYVDHFLNHDTFKGIESPDEYRFLIDLKEARGKAFSVWGEEDPTMRNFDRLHELIYLQELKVYSEIIKKYKQPSMFYLPENPDAIYDELKKAYK